MAILWRRETWYSRIFAIILFFGVIPFLSYSVGVQATELRLMYSQELSGDMAQVPVGR